MTTVLYYPISNERIKEEDTLEEKLSKCGQNTGNVVWAEAVRDNIYYDRRTLEDMYEEAEINYILPMANQINVGDICIEMYANQLLNNPNARVSMLGLGAQLTPEFNTPQKLMESIPEGQKTALKKLSERAGLIGVRGYITAECLDLLGIHNHIVIGCPSFYSYGEAFPKLSKPSLDKVCFNWSGEKRDSELNKKILRTGGEAWSCLVMQSMSDLPRTVYEDAELLERHVERLFPGGEIPPEQLTKFLKRVGKMFFNTKEWDTCLRKEGFTMSVGCRFHGNMRALLSGIPALWVTHDSRTSELTEVLHLPTISLERANNICELGELLEYCEYGQDFHLNYSVMYKNYCKCLSANGLMQK